MRVNEKLERITPNTLICEIEVEKAKYYVKFHDCKGLEVYNKVWFDEIKNLDAIRC